MRYGPFAPVRAMLSLILPLALSTAVTGCNGSEVLIPSSEEPFLYLVLNERSVDRSRARVGQHALLVTTGSPTEPPRYRRAERFSMHRASDGALFGWEQRNPGTEVTGYPALSLGEPNFLLPDTTPASTLGAKNLTPGETYTLHVETGGAVIRGEVTVPGAFTASVVQRGGRPYAVWPQVPGAAGYGIEIRLSNGNSEKVALQTETVYAIPMEVLAGGELKIRALDPNLYLYTTERRTARAGIDRGYGVFGAVTEARLTF